ncbi:MAG: GNAT family N-acetyltransferase [Nocardioides sp.]|nr:GNAT family N-acetyltransferase [Nocardioides sp.]
MTERAHVTVVDSTEKSQFEALDDSGVVAGFIDYHPSSEDPDVLVFEHIAVDDAFEGQGVGSSLVAGAMEQVRAADKKVRPDCPFVARWLDKHPDFADLRV